MSAHKSSERYYHYGPSEVVHIEDFANSKYLLCKYDNMISCNTVKSSFLLFWKSGNYPIGFENDKTKPLAYSWGSSDPYWEVYGIVNDDRIKRVEIILDDGRILTQSEFYDDLFLFTWESFDNHSLGSKNLKGYDSDNNVIYEVAF